MTPAITPFYHNKKETSIHYYQSQANKGSVLRILELHAFEIKKAQPFTIAQRLGFYVIIYLT
jgi:hypothetical protein